MNIQEIIKILTDSGMEKNEASAEVKLLIEHFCAYGVKDIISARPLDYEKLKIVKEKAEFRAKTHCPIQYIIGYVYFMRNKYTVTPDVLIPRDETELVVLHAINIINKHKFKNILEIGTGSGCIACSVAQNTDCIITASDISIKALDIAKKNAANLNIKNIEFINSDIYDNITKKFDLIISNPPYVPRNAKVQKELSYEPAEALFTNDDIGVEYHRKIIQEAEKYLNDDGYIVFELGLGQSDIVKRYFEETGYKDIVILKDLAGIDRVISARRA